MKGLLLELEVMLEDLADREKQAVSCGQVLLKAGHFQAYDCMLSKVEELQFCSSELTYILNKNGCRVSDDNQIDIEEQINGDN